MDAVPFLFEDQDFQDEPLSGKTDDPEDYNYLSHVYTWNFPEVKEVLAEFTEDVHVNTNDEGVVMLEALSEDLTTEDMMSFYACSDFPFNFNLIVNLKPEELSGIKTSNCQAQVQVPGQVQVRSRSGPRSGPKGPRAKDQRPGPGLTLNLVCHHPPLTTHHPANFSWADNHSKPLLNDF